MRPDYVAFHVSFRESVGVAIDAPLVTLASIAKARTTSSTSGEGYDVQIQAYDVIVGSQSRRLGHLQFWLRGD